MHGRITTERIGRPAGGHAYTASAGHKAQLTTAYQDLGRELSSSQIKTVGNYVLGRDIGEGSFGKVKLAVHKLTSQRCAVKQIPRSLAPPLLTREIHHHRRLHHPHVLQLYEVIATEQSIWLVSELCAGGELFDYLVEKGRLGEMEARRMFGQLCLGVGYVHGQGVVHRDLKLENILLDERCNIKIGDFGFGREFEQRRLMETFCGTTGYAAPEMLAGKKYTGEEVDIWSLGVILYALLTGSLPFDDDDEDEMKKKILKGSYDLPDWLSDESRNLITSILQQDPLQRLTIRQILGHEWFSQSFHPSPNPAAYHPYGHLDNMPAPIPEEYSDLTETGTLDTTSAPRLSNEPVSAVSDTSTTTWHSANTANGNDIGLGIRNDSGSIAGTAEQSALSADMLNMSAANSLYDSSRLQLPRNVSQRTVTAPDILPESALLRTQSGTYSDASLSSFRYPPASPSMLEQLSQSSPALPVPAHSRTPSRTKRRSIGSTMSERIQTHYEPPPDYVSLLAITSTAPFTTLSDKELIENLAQVGLDTGQIIHSVRNHACDASSAMWWMLKAKAESREPEAQDYVLNAPARSASMSSLAPSSIQHGPPPAGGRASPLPRQRVAEHAISDSTTVIAPTTSQDAYFSPQDVTHTDDVHVVEYGGPMHTPSPRQLRIVSANAARFSSVSAPSMAINDSANPLLTLSASPSDNNISANEGKRRQTMASATKLNTTLSSSVSSGPSSPSKSPGRPRSASVNTVSMLARASSALGVSKTLRPGDSPPTTGDQARLSSSTFASAFFSRKPSGGSVQQDKPPLVTKKSKDLLQPSWAVKGTGANATAPVLKTENDTTSAGISAEKAKRDEVVKESASAALPESGFANKTERQSLNADDSLEASLSKSATASANADRSSPSLPGKSLDTSVSSSTKEHRASKGLFSNFKMWFNDDRRKQKRQRVSTVPFGQENHDRAVANQATLTRRAVIPSPHPLQRPPLSRIPSNGPTSSGPSRRNSSASARRIGQSGGVSPLVVQRRRRSDASRKSIGSATDVRTSEEKDRDISSLSHQLASAAVGQSSSLPAILPRSRHVRAGSSGSTTSRHSTMLSGSPVAAFRRTPAVTQVRRIGPSHSTRMRSAHSRSHSNASSVHSAGSRQSSISEAPDAEPSTIAEENETLDASVESERHQALHKLSGVQDNAISDTALKPSLSRRQSGDSNGNGRRRHTHSQAHSRSSSTSAMGNLITTGHSRHHTVSGAHHPTLFAAHKVVNPFGTPNGAHFSHSHKRTSSQNLHGPIRDVFRDKDPDGEGEWVDEKVTYTGGFGQLGTDTASVSSHAKRAGGRESFDPGQSPTPAFGEGRYAALSGQRTDCAMPNPSNGTIRKAGGAAKGPSFKRAAIVEEEEEEDE